MLAISRGRLPAAGSLLRAQATWPLHSIPALTWSPSQPHSQVLCAGTEPCETTLHAPKRAVSRAKPVADTPQCEQLQSGAAVNNAGHWARAS